MSEPEDGVWVETTETDGAETFVEGTCQNPVSTWEEAKALMEKPGITPEKICCPNCGTTLKTFVDGGRRFRVCTRCFGTRGTEARVD